VNNTVQNLAALGKDFDFGFMGEPAGLRHQPAPDRIFQPVHPWPRRACRHPQHAAGGLHRLRLATVLGVFAGVLRLSNNWIVARLMAVYVEGFRNIPCSCGS
jgi:general L-amino acid transport system permease protein